MLQLFGAAAFLGISLTPAVKRPFIAGFSRGGSYRSTEPQGTQGGRGTEYDLPCNQVAGVVKEAW